MPNLLTRCFEHINNRHSSYLNWQSRMGKNKLYLLFNSAAYIPAIILSIHQITEKQSDALVESTGYNTAFNRAFLIFGLYETIIFTTNLALRLSQKYYNRPQLPDWPANNFSYNFNNAISKYILISRVAGSIYAIIHAAISAESFNEIMRENHSDAGANNITFLTYFGITSLFTYFCLLATGLFCGAGCYPCRHPEELRENPNQDEGANPAPEQQPNNALARPLFNNVMVEIDVQGLGGNEPRRLMFDQNALDQFINRNVAQANPPQINPEIISQIIARVTQRINEGGLLDDIANMQDRPNAQSVSINNASDTHSAVIAGVICAICLNQITAEQEQVENGLTSEIATLDNCGHQYHRQCLALWDAARRSRADCPNCRRPFTLTPQA